MLEETFLDFRAPKSPKRFFFPFSPSPKSHSPPPLPPLPPLPTFNPASPYTAGPRTPSRRSHTLNSSTSSNTPNGGLGYGAQVVRTPSEALRGVRHHTPKVQVERGESRTTTSGTSMEELRRSKGDLKHTLRTHKSEATLANQREKSGSSPFDGLVRGSSYAQPVSDMRRRRQSISAAAKRTDDHYLDPQSSFSSISSLASPPVPEKTTNDVFSSRKQSHRSMAPRSRYDPPAMGSLGHISTFDPFGSIVSPTSAPSSHSSAPPVSARIDDKYLEKKCRRSTINKPTPRSAPAPVGPFEAILVSKTVKPSPTLKSTILITLHFGYSTDSPPRNESVTIPWEKIVGAGGHLLQWLEGMMPDDEGVSDDGQPEMTDDSSAEENEVDDYDLNNLLRDEYLKSLFIASPTEMDFPAVTTRPVRPIPRESLKTPRTGSMSKPKRAVTRNQYTQLIPHPSPLSSFVSPIAGLCARRRVPGLKIEAEEMNGGGRVITYTALLCRDAAVYHAIIGRLCAGSWGRMEGMKRRRVEEECRWLGMRGLVGELEAIGQKSMVSKGGEGYI